MFSINLAVHSGLGREIFTSFSLALNKNDKIALIGEEGNGKSTILKALNNSIDESSFNVSLFTPQPIYFGLLQQHLDLEGTIFDYVCEDYSNYSEFSSLFSKIFPNFKIDDMYRPINTFSGGEKIRIQILKLWMMQADCYLLDEPTNDLDLESIKWLENWILEETRPIIFVTHDIELMKNTSNKIIHVEKLNHQDTNTVTVYEGGYEAYSLYRIQQIENHNQRAIQDKKHQEKQEEKWRRLYQNVNNSLRATLGNNPEQGRLLKKKMKQVKASKKQMDRQEIRKKIEVEEAIELKFKTHNSYAYNKILCTLTIPEVSIEGKTLVENINLEIMSKDKIVIVGRNGIGKTLTLKEIIKHIPSYIHYEVMTQNYYETLDYSKNCLDNLWDGYLTETLEVIQNHLGSLKFSYETMMQEVSKLSEGEKAKLCFLKLVLANPDIIILDEPTRNLSPLSLPVIYNVRRVSRGYSLCES